MIFNPLYLYLFEDTGLYNKNNFLRHCRTFFRSLVGNDRFELFGFLDYLFVLPGLVKLAYKPRDFDSGIFKIVMGFFLVISSILLTILKHISAFVLTIVLLPLIYVISKCFAYKGSQLKKNILEAEVLPVNQKILEGLDYNKSNSLVSKKKLYDKFYGNNGNNRIKLKNHPNRDQLLENNMKQYILESIMLTDEKGERLKDDNATIFGLFPRIACPFGRTYHLISAGTLPDVLIVFSKENKPAIKAIQKLNAFFFSKARNIANYSYEHETYLANLPLGKNYKPYLQKADPLKQIEQQQKSKRRTILYALHQTSMGAVDKTPMAEINNSIDPLITMVTQFAGTGALDPGDIAFGKKLMRSNIFHRSSKNEFKSTPLLSTDYSIASP